MTKKAVTIESPSFVTSRGIEIPCQAVNRWLIDSFKSSKEEVLPPTYEVETVAGTKEIHYHDEQSLETDEQKAAFAEYLEKKRRIETEHNRKLYELLVLYGTTVKLPDDNKWLARLSRVGVKLPSKTNPDGSDNENYDDDLYLFYLQNECFGIEEDAMDLMIHIMQISGTDREVAQQLKKTFRAAIQEARDERNKAQRARTLGK